MTETTTGAGRKEWTGLIVLVLPCVLVSMDMSVLYFALPWLSADLSPTGPQLLWIMDVYSFLLAGSLITMGTLGDRIGRRRLLLIGAAAFGAASLVAAYSSDAVMLIASRALLGLAGATLAPSTLALIRNMFHDPRQRRSAIGVWTAGFAGGAVLGPVIGGLLLEHFWWGSAFLINVPVMVLLLVLAPMLVPEYRDPRPGRFDVLSAGLSLAAVLPVVYGVKLLAEDGIGWSPLPALLTGAVFGAWFVRRQARLADPMIDLRLFASPAFSAALVVNTLAMFALGGLTLFTTQYLQLVAGLRPFTAALWMLPAIMATMAGVTLATMLVRVTRPGFVVGAGLALGATGMLTVRLAGVDTGVTPIVTGAALLAVGVGMVATLATDLIVATAPPERAGAASALSESGTELGGALGIAVLGTAGAVAYRDRFAGTAPPGSPAEARESLPAAVTAAGRLPERLRDPLLDASFDAFVAGLHTVALSGALLLAAAAAAAPVLLRRMRPDRAAVDAAAR
ncbi:MFS transporter [Streptosporangium soli]|nr:MFS transporter [Streptosporangium sp. KLBMP 9127]